MTNVEHKSAVPDHADRLDCVVDWVVEKVVDRDSKD